MNDTETNWVYMGEDLNAISPADKRMLEELKATGAFTPADLLRFNQCLVSKEYNTAKLEHAKRLHAKNKRKSVLEYYRELTADPVLPSLRK